jgi:hypothetical protein
VNRAVVPFQRALRTVSLGTPEIRRAVTGIKINCVTIHEHRLVDSSFLELPSYLCF